MKKIYSALLFMIALNFTALAQAPVLSGFSGPSAVCSVPTTSLNVFSVSASNSPTSFVWTTSPSTGVIISGSGSSVSISFPNTNLTYFVYCVASNGSGASNTVSRSVTVFETPSVTFSGFSPYFCQGSSTNISASSTILYSASSSLSYNWSGNNLNVTTGPNVIVNPSVTSTYTVDVTLGQCVNTYQLTMNAFNCVGISNVASPVYESVSIYPNPSNGTFMVKSLHTEKVYIYNELGQTIRQIDMIANEESEIRGLEPGIYFVITGATKRRLSSPGNFTL